MSISCLSGQSRIYGQEQENNPHNEEEEVVMLPIAQVEVNDKQLDEEKFQKQSEREDLIVRIEGIYEDSIRIEFYSIE